MDITIFDILLFLFVAWIARQFILSPEPNSEALQYVRERIDGMEFELEYIDGVWYCWILEGKVYTFVGQNTDRPTLEDACKKRVHEMCVKGLTG